ncbi:efflux RND transporter periplasmic adaptor subunit [Haliscomenobacter hydrossis]|uniref:Efflux transporter, RND family, MFP subunit n=1 Tax=Haliscomenobacter hydrossis (strain ATCC 27775 / DSM 1100 / LMG 10767 / O) TaxID=760192 RepID=F4KVC1_HALH1|nr:efflux RND transporter periplasmic adaptor subunit [Haliscomenobacter hydrossis]AEE50247.1 efflux transporter, RND family, MFP subunit [Haliscomenobacter hydrossis DSM 1100]
MDRELAPEIIRKQRFKGWGVALVVLLALGASYYLLNKVLRTQVRQSEVRVAVAETGNVENTLTASGEVIPAFEQVLTSPIRASVKQVLLSPGAAVRPGQQILILDKSLSLIELDKLKDQLELKRNSVEKLKFQLEKESLDADLDNQIKGLSINRQKTELEDTRRLHKIGGRTQEDISRAENALKISELEKDKLENQVRYNRQSKNTNIRESELQVRIEENGLKELQHKLKMADLVADRPGVLTWVNDKVGTTVNEGEMLAKIADLQSFRIEGSASDTYAEQVQIGLPVIVRINETDLRGMITQIKPSVENDVVQFSVQLDDAQNAALRPNMKVEIFVVTSRAKQSVRVANGPAFNGKKRQNIFVLENGLARRREIEVGLSNFDYVEIKNGIRPGEKVIVTDLSRFEHLREITLKP